MAGAVRMMEGFVELEAFAKINLGLDVLSRREDGYHLLRTVMQTVDLCDRITIRREAEKGIRLSCDLPSLPADEKNLAYRAAALLQDIYRLPGGVGIGLKKNIPMAAGLAGGSADAAAVLRGMNRLYDLGLTREELEKHASKLGADVPFCISGGTVLAEGIGEKLTVLPDIPDCAVVIVKPDFDVSTAEAFRDLHAELLPESIHPDMDSVLSAIRAGDVPKAARSMGNILETVTERKYPVIGEIKREMKKAGAWGALMSGSGSSVFGLFPDRALALGYCETYQNKTDRKFYSGRTGKRQEDMCS